MTDVLEELLSRARTEEGEDIPEELLLAAVEREKLPPSGRRKNSEKTKKSPKTGVQRAWAEEEDLQSPETLWPGGEKRTEFEEDGPEGAAESRREQEKGAAGERTPLLRALEASGLAARRSALPAHRQSGQEGEIFPNRLGEEQDLPDRVRQVDRAFERDARRYDSGFTLY